MPKPKEVKQYSQESAEFLSELFNALNTISISGIDPEFKKEFDKIDEIRIKMHKKVFTIDSQWEMYRNKKGIFKIRTRK